MNKFSDELSPTLTSMDRYRTSDSLHKSHVSHAFIALLLSYPMYLFSMMPLLWPLTSGLNPISLTMVQKFTSAICHLVSSPSTESCFLVFLQPKPSSNLCLNISDLSHVSCAIVFTDIETYILRIFDFLSYYTSKMCYNSAISVSRPFLKSLLFWPKLTLKNLNHHLFCH